MLTIGQARNKDLIKKEEAETLVDNGVTELSSENTNILEENLSFKSLKKIMGEVIPGKEPEVNDEPEVDQCVAKTRKGTRCSNAPKYPKHNPKYCGVHWKSLGDKQKTQLKSEATSETEKTKNNSKGDDNVQTKNKSKSKIQYVHPKKGVTYIDLRDLSKQERLAGKVLFIYVEARTSKNPKETHKLKLVGKKKDGSKITITYPRLESGNYGYPGKRISSRYQNVHKKLLDKAYMRGKAYQEQK